MIRKWIRAAQPCSPLLTIRDTIRPIITTKAREGELIRQMDSLRRKQSKFTSGPWKKSTLAIAAVFTFALIAFAQTTPHVAKTAAKEAPVGPPVKVYGSK